MHVSAFSSSDATTVARLREQIACARTGEEEALAFDVHEIDDQLAAHGLDGAGLHEVAAASAALTDDAAATLFIAGIAARFARSLGGTVLWALTRFDLYAPGLEQAGLSPDRVLYAQGHGDSEVLAMAEDSLRSSSLACVVAELKSADRIATRRLQLAAADGRTPMLLYRRHRTNARCPLETPSSAMTRWRIGSVRSGELPVAGVGRGRWLVELVRQRNGNPFSLELEACDDTGRLALPATASHRATAAVRAINQAA